ncbi:MAG: hypothetical protein ACJ764_09875 [Solirubrobacteraceae bacterium]
MLRGCGSVVCRRALLVIGVSAALGAGAAPALAGTRAQPGERVSHIHMRAEVDLAQLAHAAAHARPNAHPLLVSPGKAMHRSAGTSIAQDASSLGGANAPASRVVVGGQTGAFNGISGIDQEAGGTGKYAGTGETLEPPDQGVCSNGSYVIETVNDALRVYTSTGHKLTKKSILLSEFFNRAAGGTTGPTDFISDPRCVYDNATHRWFVTMLDITSIPTYPSFADDQNFIAVSQTDNPMGKWKIFSFDVTDNGLNGSPVHPGCLGPPIGTVTAIGCLGDQPTIGFDRYGIYITDNEYAMAEVFPVAPPVYPPLQQIPVLRSGVAQLYALSKSQLVNGKSTTLVRFDSSSLPFPGPKEDSPWQSISPATAVPHDSTREPAAGVEYFLSSVGLPVDHSVNKIVVWAWSNTKSLTTGSPHLKLQHVTIPTAHPGDTFFAPDPAAPSSTPFKAYQKQGPHPTASAAGDPEEYLNANDDRMNWVAISRGSLWTNVDTLLPPTKPGATGHAGEDRVGIMYFKVKPTLQHGVLKAKTVRDGYLNIAKGNLLFGTIGPRADGATVMTMSLAGIDHFPSVAWARLDGLKAGVAPVIHIAQKGVAPEDGFSGLGTLGSQGLPDIPPCGPCVARWGDYSETEVAPNGCIWGAAEDVPTGKHDQFNAINWGTGVYDVCPASLTSPQPHTGHHPNTGHKTHKGHRGHKRQRPTRHRPRPHRPRRRGRHRGFTGLPVG